MCLVETTVAILFFTSMWLWNVPPCLLACFLWTTTSIQMLPSKDIHLAISLHSASSPSRQQISSSSVNRSWGMCSSSSSSVPRINCTLCEGVSVGGEEKARTSNGCKEIIQKSEKLVQSLKAKCKNKSCVITSIKINQPTFIRTWMVQASLKSDFRN